MIDNNGLMLLAALHWLCNLLHIRCALFGNQHIRIMYMQRRSDMHSAIHKDKNL